MEAIARLVDATRRPELDAELRDMLLLATTDVRIANQKLSALLDACPICGQPGLKRVCRSCGAHRNAPMTPKKTAKLVKDVWGEQS